MAGRVLPLRLRTKAIERELREIAAKAVRDPIRHPAAWVRTAVDSVLARAGKTR